MLGPSALMGPILFVLFPLTFSTMAFAAGHPGGACLLLPAALYVANWTLLVPRYLEIDVNGLVVAYWLHRLRIPAKDVTCACTVRSEDVLKSFGILLPHRLWGGISVRQVGPVRIIATEYCMKYALVSISSGLPLLIGCDFPGDAVHAIRLAVRS